MWHATMATLALRRCCVTFPSGARCLATSARLVALRKELAADAASTSAIADASEGGADLLDHFAASGAAPAEALIPRPKSGGGLRGKGALKKPSWLKIEATRGESLANYTRLKETVKELKLATPVFCAAKQQPLSLDAQPTPRLYTVAARARAFCSRALVRARPRR